MSNSLKITADTSEVKKSILNLGKSLKDIKGSKVTIFSPEDKKFMKTEMKRELILMKSKLQENRAEIKKLVAENKNLLRDSKEELANRKKIIDAYKVQARLGKELAETHKATKNAGGGVLNSLAGGGTGIMGAIGGALGLGILAAGAFALAKSIQATSQYTAGAAKRVQLKGLGVSEDNFGSPEALAKVGLTEQEMIQRRVEATQTLGRAGSSTQTEMKKAGFERAFGLEGGTMTGVATQLRGQAGGQAATDVQMKLQATILAAGIEDAIGPYLETATKLLGEINENGDANTTQMLGILAQLSKDGQRTPEALSKMLSSVNNSVKNATGESSAFIQTAFAKAGIGGGTIGGTKMAMESGGILGLNKDELAKRGYNPKLLESMGKSGMFEGMGKRSGALLNQFKQSGGLKAGQNISDISDMGQFTSMSNLANSQFGTKGNQGFEVLQMLEKVQNKQMTQKEFDAKVEKMQTETPETKRLDEINATLAGQTNVLTSINTNLMENLGKEGVVTRNALVKGENAGLEGTTGLVKGINDTGAPEGAGNAIKKTGDYLFKGGLGSDIYDFMHKDRKKEFEDNMQIETPTGNKPIFPSAKDIGSEVANAIQKSPPPTNKITVRNNVGGHVTERTVK